MYRITALSNDCQSSQSLCSRKVLAEVQVPKAIVSLLRSEPERVITYKVDVKNAIWAMILRNENRDRVVVHREYAVGERLIGADEVPHLALDGDVEVWRRDRKVIPSKLSSSRPSEPSRKSSCLGSKTAWVLANRIDES